MNARNIAVVCVRPQGSGNLGALARVMMNFGFRDLVLVAPRCAIDEQSFRMACHAGDILRNARAVDALAVLDPEFQGYIGTCGRVDPSVHGEPSDPATLPAMLSRTAPGARLALLLGPEDHGLANAELKRCRWIVRIPADPEYPSLNIAQAAAILLYELGGRGRPRPEPAAAVRLATAAEMEQLFAQLRRLLIDAGFLHRNNPERIMFPLRRLLFRAGPEEREVRILRGILRQLGWAFRQAGFPPADTPPRDAGGSAEID